MTYSELVEEFSKISVSEPEHETLLLLEALFGITRADTILSPGRDYSSPSITGAIRRRALGEPIQYIIGRVFFYNCELKVSPACLIPRADTEILCEELINRLPANAHFLEFCTGSGCIPIAVLKERDDLTCESIELFESTVGIAIENRKLNNIAPDRLKISQGDALKFPVSKHIAEFDAIVSNPPYIKSDDVRTLAREVRHEPHAALDGGADGLLFYNKFLCSYAPMLKPNGFFAFEIGFDQAAQISDMCTKLGFACKIIKDYSGNDRVALILTQGAK